MARSKDTPLRKGVEPDICSRKAPKGAFFIGRLGKSGYGFGMIETIADDLWGKPCLAYHVQPTLRQETRAALADLQAALARRCPVPLHVAPPHALHVTIYALVPVKDRFDKEGYWNSIAGPSFSLVERICRGRPPIELHFSRLKVTDVAVIAVAEDDSGLIKALREAIAEELPPPPGLKPLRYDLVHTTLARYRSSEPLRQAEIERIEQMPVSIRSHVERIRIVRETLFPCLEADDIASVPLIERKAETGTPA